MKLSIINGPNLNLLGKRETNIYGNQDFDIFLKKLKCDFKSCSFSYFQSNIEGELIDAIGCLLINNFLISMPHK